VDKQLDDEKILLFPRVYSFHANNGRKQSVKGKTLGEAIIIFRAKGSFPIMNVMKITPEDN
jgi:hypothetical protein